MNLINASDGGRRQCILVTNNEVAAEEAAELRKEGDEPGNDTWEARGICRSVTWPRSKFTIMGKRDDGTPILGEHFTGKTVERQKARKFIQIGFVTAKELAKPSKAEQKNKKQLVNMVEGLPQTLVTDSCRFIVSESHKASILFDPEAVEDWLTALAEQVHITNFYIVATETKFFNELKAQINDLLGPLLIKEDEKRPMADGFSANLAYYKLEFLDKERIELRQAFREILPLLWLKAGAVGPQPELPINSVAPPFFAPKTGNFAVLLEETRIRKFLTMMKRTKELSHIFIVTDSEEAFRALADEVRDAVLDGSPDIQILQLYRDYLANFIINGSRVIAGDPNNEATR